MLGLVKVCPVLSPSNIHRMKGNQIQISFKKISVFLSVSVCLGFCVSLPTPPPPLLIGISGDTFLPGRMLSCAKILIGLGSGFPWLSCCIYLVIKEKLQNKWVSVMPEHDVILEEAS